MSPNADESAVGGSIEPNTRSERLESWKEIATYLGRGVTTVQRWEQLEGLPVHRLPHAKKGSIFAVKSELDAWLTTRTQLGPAHPKVVSEALSGDHAQIAPVCRLTRKNPRLAYIGLLLFALAAVALPVSRALRVRSAGLVSPAASSIIPQPLASDAADEMCPSLSPDGRQVAYNWGRETAPGIYVKPVGVGSPRHLATAAAGRLFACGFPKWSPAGDMIAFLTSSEDSTRHVWVISPSGERLRRLTSVSGVGLCWAADGESLGFVDRNSPGEPFSIFSVALRDGQRRRLTTPPPGTFGDTHCAFSPDGERLAVSRFPNISQSDVFVTHLAGAEKGQLTRLTTGFAGIEGIDWSPNARLLVFGSHVGLWRIAANGSNQQPVRFAALQGSARHPSFSRAGVGSQLRLAYGSELRDVNVWRWDRAQRQAKKVAGSTWWEDYPAVSPDGKRLAFASNRTGATEIWVAAADGGDPQQVTFHQGPIVTAPTWSPDGKWLAFSSEVAGNRDIYVIRPDGAQSNRLTTTPTEERNPSWSRDGRWLYFRSNQEGVGQIWKIARAGGAPIRVTTGEASEAMEAPNGKLLYFVRNMHLPGLWSVPVGGGPETLVLPEVREGWWGITDTGIYFLVAAPAGFGGAVSLRFFAFASATATTVPAPTTLRRAVQPGFSVPRDGRFVFWTQIDNVSRDLMPIDEWKP